MDKEAVEMRYLLGKLSDSEAARLEERYFVEDDVYDEIETAEDELVDAYVRGSLSAGDRKRFEEKLLRSPRLAERVEFAKLLSNVASPSRVVRQESAKASWWQSLFDFLWTPNAALRGAVAVGLFLIVVGSPTVFVWLRLRDERRLATERAAIEQQKQQLDKLLSDQQSKTNQPAAEQSSKAEEERLQQQSQAAKEELGRTNTPRPVLASIFLYTSARDPDQPDVLTVPSTTSTIQLKLVVDSNDYPSYQAAIKAPDNRVVLTRSGLKLTRSGKARIIDLRFPSRLLISGDYVVSVSGRKSSGTYDPIAGYPVRVAKK